MQRLTYVVFISLARYTTGRNRAYTPAGQLTTRDFAGQCCEQLY